MLDIPDCLIDDRGAARVTSARPEPRRPADSPLRPWGMWGGLGALGVICAASVAHAVALVGRSVARPG